MRTRACPTTEVVRVSRRNEPIRLGFVCVKNAGRSQIAGAVAETHLQVHGRSDVAVITGGTDPTDAIYPAVVEVMAEKGYDLSDRSPQKITQTELKTCDIVALMGCALSIDDLPTGVVVRDWDFIDPARDDIETVRAISTDIEQRVIELIVELPTPVERYE